MGCLINALKYILYNKQDGRVLVVDPGLQLVTNSLLVDFAGFHVKHLCSQIKPVFRNVSALGFGMISHV
jgi:hypothetical protein